MEMCVQSNMDTRACAHTLVQWVDSAFSMQKSKLCVICVDVDSSVAARCNQRNINAVRVQLHMAHSKLDSDMYQYLSMVHLHML